jgi:transcriptional regulator with XRE-family HTH domain
VEGFGARLAARARELGLTNAEVARLSERRFGNYTTDTREPDLQTLVTLARVLAITVGELLGVVTERTGMDRDRLLAQNEAALSQISDSELEMISVQLRAVAEWRKI